MDRSLRVSMRVLVAVVAACAGIALLGRFYLDAKDEAARSECLGNLAHIGLALHNYHAVYDCFPPAYIADASGKPMHSWRLLIVPFIESSKVYNNYNFAEPWDGPNNASIANVTNFYFSCPYHRSGRSPYTSYVALVGPGTVFPGDRQTKMSDVRDGTSNTLMIVEIADADIIWTEPRDLDVTRMHFAVNGPHHPGISSKHGPGANVCFVDSSRRWVAQDVRPEVLKAWITIAGGEPVPKP